MALVPYSPRYQNRNADRPKTLSTHSTFENDGLQSKHTQAFVQIGKWIDDCRQLHDCYNDHIRTLPTRLIHVGSAQNNVEPRLIETASYEFSADDSLSARFDPSDYATLSYCWGNSYQNCILTDLNLHERLQCIPHASLPGTIRDAVTICRRLGVRFLWVDALCIIQAPQGNSDDWSIESTRIGEYYSGSAITIAATWASHNNQGCFPDNAECERLYASCKARQRGVLNHWDEIQSSALVKRGWVLQELCLSRRVVYFTFGCLFWKCDGVITSDDARSPGCSITMLQGIRQRKTLVEPVQPTPWQRKAIFDFYSLVSEYTACSLTFKSDLFPAFAGLCKAYENTNSGDRYLAGIWKNSLVRGLSWSGSSWNQTSPKKQQHVRTTPTWSWASLEREIHYASLWMYDLTTYYSCNRVRGYGAPQPSHDWAQFTLKGEPQIELAYPHPHGPVKCGRLTVQGLFLDARIDVTSVETPSAWSGPKLRVLVRGRSFVAEMDYEFTVGDDTHCFFLLLYHNCTSHDPTIGGLLLRNSGLRSWFDVQYERIGIASYEPGQSKHEAEFEQIFCPTQSRIVTLV